jgi:hypothetical protein
MAGMKEGSDAETHLSGLPGCSFDPIDEAEEYFAPADGREFDHTRR